MTDSDRLKTPGFLCTPPHTPNSAARVDVTLESLLDDDVGFIIIVWDPCFQPFTIDWERLRQYASKRTAATASVRLAPAYPNPFNPETRFTLTLDDAQPVTVTAYDLLGREMVTWVDGTLPPDR